METIYDIKTIRVKLKVKDCGAKISAPDTAVPILKAVFENLDADQEHFVILALDKGNQVKGFKVVHTGGIDETAVDVKCVLRYALLFGATGIILAHNHPSGRLVASPEDRAITNKIQQAAGLLNLAVLDHIIVGNQTSNGYFSFRESGIMS